MKKLYAGLAVALVAIGLISAVIYGTKKDDTPTNLGMSQSQMEQMSSYASSQNQRQQTSGKVQSGQVSVDIADFDYTPKDLRIKAGTKVTWTNKDSVRHDVMPDTDSPDFIGSNGLLAQDESYSFTFTKPGTYTYHCTPHPYMKATVEVIE